MRFVHLIFRAHIPSKLLPGEKLFHLPGLQVKGFCYILTTKNYSLSSDPLRSFRHHNNNPTSCALPSAFVSVLPSSSHKGVSCSRVGRKENKCRSMDQIWWTSILKATLVVSPRYLHIHILETKLDERNVMSERQTARKKLVVVQLLIKFSAMPRGTPVSSTII